MRMYKQFNHTILGMWLLIHSAIKQIYTILWNRSVHLITNCFNQLMTTSILRIGAVKWYFWQPVSPSHPTPSYVVTFSAFELRQQLDMDRDDLIMLCLLSFRCACQIFSQYLSVDDGANHCGLICNEECRRFWILHISHSVRSANRVLYVMITLWICYC